MNTEEAKKEKHSHYFKDVSGLKSIDVYRVIELFEVNHPALQHALKKVLAAGRRGAKSAEQDAHEAIDSLNRFLEMLSEDAGEQSEKKIELPTIQPEITSDNCTEITLPKNPSVGDALAFTVNGPAVVRLPDSRGPTNPHAELRKTWRPEQRWQFRNCDHDFEWTDLDGKEPSWKIDYFYRRHPDDKDGSAQ